ncbi:MAG: TerB family tellurite resistance protein [Vicinamibacteria bacterium]|jgi:uncharacterized tellurite resistance protein B-like protein|nr:TerB family tellurite resistance protein [Vicinamibacteria bacterium]
MATPLIPTVDDSLKTSLLDALDDFVDSVLAETAEPGGDALSEPHLRLAAAVLMVAIVRADFEIQDVERRAILAALRRVFNLTEQETRELMVQAHVQSKRPPRLHEYARYIDQRCTPEQKRHIVQSLWQVAFADAELLAHEEYLVRKIAELLHLTPAEFLAAKISAREDFR